MTPSALLDRHRRTALRSLDAAAGDRSLCEISRDGTTPGVKRHEGAVAALGDVRRAAGDASGGPGAGLRAAVLTTREAWAARAGAPGAGWAEYRAGGLDALDRLAGELSTLGPGPGDDVEAPASSLGGGVEAPAFLVGDAVEAPASPAAGGAAGPTPVLAPPADLVTLGPEVTATLLELWPRRRVLVALVLIGPTAWFLFRNIGGWAPDAPLWNALVVLVAVVAAAIVATYVPLPGNRGVDVGCRPCAAVAGVTALCAGSLLGSAPQDVGLAVVALGLVSFGLVQRQRGARSCPAPTT